MECTLCNTSLNEMADEFYFICQTCGAYVKDEKYFLNEEEEKERYQTHNNDVNDERYKEFTSPITNAILKNHTRDHLGLDYGCGTGPVISKQLKDNGFQVKLYDPFFHPSEEYMKHNYEYIFSCEVFEHFYNPKHEIEKLNQILKPGGKLYIMTHIFNPSLDFVNWYYRLDPTHVFIYTKKTIEYIAQIYHLEIEKITDRLVILKK